jgi:hypothetical protein
MSFMATTAELPVNLSVHAADRIVELGVWPQFKAMLDHTQHSTSGLRSISVSLDEESGGGDPMILLIAEVEELNLSQRGTADKSTEWQWDRWAVETFPPDVLRHFCMMTVPVADASSNGR